MCVRQREPASSGYMPVMKVQQLAMNVAARRHGDVEQGVADTRRNLPHADPEPQLPGYLFSVLDMRRASHALGYSSLFTDLLFV